MALFETYVKPGVYTDVTLEEQGAPLFGDARIPVLIGEGVEEYTFSNKELHRGSSASADDKVVGENISDQVDGLSRTFQLHYFPVVKGDGTGTLTNDPRNIQVLADGVPLTVTSLNGTTGVFQTQTIPPEGTNLEVQYFFKRLDTFVELEDLSAQVPAFASLAVVSNLTLSLTVPGAIGNTVTVKLTKASAGNGKADALAVTGSGTDDISIEIQKTNDTTRTLAEIKQLVDAGIPTASAGYLTATVVAGHEADAATAAAVKNLAGGEGSSSNKIFKTQFTPIVDGSNGGVITTNPADVAVFVNSVKVAVAAVDGDSGLVTLAQPVVKGATLEISYYTNNYQDTFDLLPAKNVAAIVQVGYAPDRSDFVEGIDYVLDGDKIYWGASAITKVGVSTGSVAFDGKMITTALRDEQVFLRPLSGAVNGVNTIFTLIDSPTETTLVDGSGLSRVTNDPAKISVYVGADPVTALKAGKKTVVRLDGTSKQVTLYDAPQPGQAVFATYYRSRLADNTFTLKVAVPDGPGKGTYTIVDQNANVLPVTKEGTHVVSDGGFAASNGIQWPNSFSDLAAVAGGVDEEITVTFQDDGLGTQSSAPTAATVTTQGITFTADVTMGALANGTTLAFVSIGSTDRNAVKVNGEAITIDIQKADGTTRTVNDVVALFAGTTLATTIGTPNTKKITATGSSTNQVAQAAAVALAAGTNQTVSEGTEYANRFLVTSSVEGGTTGEGYIGQTYIDAVTGVKFTIGDPANAPTPYKFKAGDVLIFTVSKSTARVVGSKPTIDIPGLRVTVTTTANTAVADTAIVSTFNKAGEEPKVGDFYYVSFTTAKTDADMALKIFTNPKDAYAEYGYPSITNRLALGIYFARLNGAQTFGCIQVRKQPGMAVASSQSFIAAIQSLAQALPGNEDRKADVILPLTTDATVQGVLNNFLLKQAGPRMKGEAQSFVGFDQYATPVQGRNRARGMKNSRVIAIQPGVWAVSLDSGNGVAYEYPVTGEFVAAALAGLRCSPTNDDATTLTGQKLAGFSRALKRYDEPTLDMMATDGLTCVVDVGGALEIRHYKTTDPSTPLTSEPTCIQVEDHCRQAFRKALKPFTGRKYVASLLNDIKLVANATLRSRIDAEIIEAYTNLEVTLDENDPTVVHVSVKVKPIFSVLWIGVNFTFTTKL